MIEIKKNVFHFGALQLFLMRNLLFLSSYDPNERKLISCIRKNNVSILEKYIQSGYSINHRASKFVPFTDQLLKHSPSLICLSAFYHSLAVFRYLLINNADIYTTDDIGTPISHFAIAGGSLEIVMLLDDLNVSFDDAIFVAAERGNLRMFVWIYTNHFCDICTKNKNGESVLSLASKTKNSKLINLVIDQTKNNIELKDIFELMNDFTYYKTEVSSDEDYYDSDDFY